MIRRCPFHVSKTERRTDVCNPSLLVIPKTVVRADRQCQKIWELSLSGGPPIAHEHGALWHLLHYRPRHVSEAARRTEACEPLSKRGREKWHANGPKKLKKSQNLSPDACRIAAAEHREPRGITEQAWLRAVVRAAETDPWRLARLDSREINDPNEKRAAVDRLAGTADTDAQPARALTDLAAELHLAGLRGRAIELLKRAHEKHPENFWINAYSALFLQLVQPPQSAEALRYATAALALRPESPGVRVNLGIALQDLGRFEEAITQFREAARLRPDYAAAYNQLASVLDDQGKLDEAVAMYRKALEVAPDDALTYHNLGYTLSRQNKTDESNAAYREAIRLNPRNPMTHNNLGGQLFDQGKLDEAAVELRAALELNDQLGMAHHNLGRLLAEKGQWDEAVPHYRQAIVADPDYVETYNLLGIALAESGHLDEAVSTWTKAIELDPKNADARHNLTAAYYNMGNAHNGKGETDEAIADYRRSIEAVQTEPGNVNFLHNLAEALLDKGPESEAREACTKLFELETWRPGAKPHLVPEGRRLDGRKATR